MLSTVTVPAIAFPSPSLIVQVGFESNASEVVNCRVTVSVLLASPSPSVAIDTLDKVGLSVSTAKFDVAAVVPVLPAVSVQVFANVTVLVLSS